MIDLTQIKGMHVAIVAAVGLLGSVGYSVVSPNEQMENHAKQHVELDATLNELNGAVSSNTELLESLIIGQCIQSTKADLEVQRLSIKCSELGIIKLGSM